MPIIFSWFVGALLAAFVAFVTEKVCRPRSDYLAIATLLISGIVITIVKHEEMPTRSVKNVIGLKRPAPYEVDLQNSDWFIGMIESIYSSRLSKITDIDQQMATLKELVISSSGVFVKLCFSLIICSRFNYIAYFFRKSSEIAVGKDDARHT